MHVNSLCICILRRFSSPVRMMPRPTLRPPVTTSRTSTGGWPAQTLTLPRWSAGSRTSSVMPLSRGHASATLPIIKDNADDDRNLTQNRKPTQKCTHQWAGWLSMYMVCPLRKFMIYREIWYSIVGQGSGGGDMLFFKLRSGGCFTLPRLILIYS